MSIKEEVKKRIPDKIFLKYQYRSVMGYSLDLKDPKTLNEKLQWLKLYDRNPMYTTMVDKYEVKKFVSERIGEKYVIPTIGVWNRFDDIDFDLLPDQFVLKCTHDSGGLIICHDKSKFDFQSAKDKIEKRMKKNYYYLGREWPYKNVKPRIIIEEYLSDQMLGFNLEKCKNNRNSEELSNKGINDYKFYCFDGQADVVLDCIERNTGTTKFYFFDREWILKRYNRWGLQAPENFTLPKPENINEMFEIAGKLSQGIPFVRVDMYNVNGHIYFGEFTFYPSNGHDRGRLPETDLYFGEKLNLDLIKKNKKVDSIKKQKNGATD